MKELIVKKSMALNAEPSEVWEALTDPQMTRKYFFNCDVVTDWKIGEPIIYRDNTGEDPIDQVKGTLKHFEEGEMFEYTFKAAAKAGESQGDMIRVTFELEPENGRTRLTVTQDCGENEKVYKDSDQGWDYVLFGLKKLLEN
jgi:uncharacterized protein YndB with AHSA1/START domain